jgi:hypothetical protein
MGWERTGKAIQGTDYPYQIIQYKALRYLSGALHLLKNKQAKTITPNPSNKVSVKVNKGRFWFIVVTF